MKRHPKKPPTKFPPTMVMGNEMMQVKVTPQRRQHLFVKCLQGFGNNHFLDPCVEGYSANTDADSEEGLRQAW